MYFSAIVVEEEVEEGGVIAVDEGGLASSSLSSNGKGGLSCPFQTKAFKSLTSTTPLVVKQQSLRDWMLSGVGLALCVASCSMMLGLRMVGVCLDERRIGPFWGGA